MQRLASWSLDRVTKVMRGSVDLLAWDYLMMRCIAVPIMPDNSQQMSEYVSIRHQYDLTTKHKLLVAYNGQVEGDQRCCNPPQDWFYANVVSLSCCAHEIVVIIEHGRLGRAEWLVAQQPIHQALDVNVFWWRHR